MIIFDTETTGLVEPNIKSLDVQPKIIEFAAIKTDDDFNEIDRIDFLCHPGKPISAVITKITGIKNSDLEGKKPFAAHYNDVAEFFFGERELIAHNVQFDVDLLRFEVMRLGREFQFPWPMKHTCTAEASKKMAGFRLNLGKLYKHAFDEEFKGAHRAMVDVEALLRCAKWMRENNHI